MKPLPYARQTIEDDDIESVCAALRSDWLTTGPAVERFERAAGDFVGAPHAVAVSSGTAALHTAMAALGVGPGDEVVVPAMTFVATANAALMVGATPVFADVDPHTLLVDPASVERAIGPRTRAIVGVDYAGQPCDWAALRRIANDHGLALVDDACHALGARSRDGQRVGSLADVTVFSFHPVKHVTTAEGGMVVTADAALAQRARMFRNHGISSDHRKRAELGTWRYEMEELGVNYRLNDLQCALGVTQLAKLPAWLERRRAVARAYDAALAHVGGVRPLAVEAGVEHAWHLYVVQLTGASSARTRAVVWAALRAAGIGANVHYLPVHLHAYYRRRFGTHAGMCPAAEAAYERILSLPMFSSMTDEDVARVVAVLAPALDAAQDVARSCSPPSTATL